MKCGKKNMILTKENKMTKIKWYQQDNRLFSGFYESELYNSDMLYYMSENDDEDREWDFIPGGYEEYEKAVCKECASNLFYLMEDNDAIKSIEFTEMTSPREYNFTTDKLVCDVEIDLDKLRKYCYETNRTQFDNYLKENYSSYDGFISFIPNNVKEFEQEKDDTDVMIDFYILSHLEEGCSMEGWERLQEYNAESAQNLIYNYVQPIPKEENNQKD